jgi:thermitase
MARKTARPRKTPSNRSRPSVPKTASRPQRAPKPQRKAAKRTVKRAVTSPPATPSVLNPPVPRTFQGRRVTTITWKGQPCAAVAGLVVRKERDRAVERSASIESTTSRGLAGLGLSVVAVPVIEGAASVETLTSASLEMAAANVEWTEPVLLDHISRIPGDPLVSEQWGIEAIDGGAAFDVTANPSPVLLAVLDSGLPIEAGQQSHQELQGQRFISGHDVVSSDDDPADDHGHGTHVLGIAAANADNGAGVAGLWPGSVLVVKVFDSLGAGSSVAFADGVAAAVEFATARSLRLVINYSGGGPDSETKKTAVEFARDNGALVVAAAGNNFGSPIDFPAAYSSTHDNVIAVGAVDRDNALADFCNIGPEMNVVAPGVDILSTLPNYFVTLNASGKQTKFDRMDGTSQATPYVSAIAALIWAQEPALSAARVKERLLAAAVQLPDGNTGSGMLNARRALT